MGARSSFDEQRKDILPQCPGEWQWACRNGECIARYDTCDGIPQCSDGSDEWNCEQWRQKQDRGFSNPEKGATRSKPTTQASTITAVAQDGYVVLSTREVIVTLAVFATLAVLLVLVIRRRARARALARNRRGNLLQNFQGDSDEDDILISSMYS